LAEFIKRFVKLGDQMCKLNYKETRIKIGVKLGAQKYNCIYKKWSIYREPLRCWHVTLTRESLIPNRTFRTNFAGIYKIGDQICELNYRETKSKIRDKLGTKSAILPKKVWWIGLIIKFIRLFCYYVIIFNNQCVNNLYF